MDRRRTSVSVIFSFSFRGAVATMRVGVIVGVVWWWVVVVVFIMLVSDGSFFGGLGGGLLLSSLGFQQGMFGTGDITMWLLALGLLQPAIMGQHDLDGVVEGLQSIVDLGYSAAHCSKCCCFRRNDYRV